MFYSTQILAKKGPLGTIWIAAHLDRRLKRHQVFEANIAISVGAFSRFFGLPLTMSCPSKPDRDTLPHAWNTEPELCSNRRF